MLCTEEKWTLMGVVVRLPRMQAAELLILLLVSIVVFGLLAKRWGIPEPILFVLAGLSLGFIPGLPRIELAPEYVFLVVLPPLLYAQAWTTSWHDFRSQLRAISFLAVGLVLFTTLAVGWVFHVLVPEMPIAVGFLLGAIVSPPDAVAASAIAQRLKLSKRMVTILEGESLVNDATGLVAYKFALVALLSGTFSLGGAAIQFVWVSAGGVGVGLVFGWVFGRLLTWIKDDMIDIALSLATPYVAYVVAERLHLSGVLSTVACGLWLGARGSAMLSASTRLTGVSFWNTLVFLLNGAVFMLIGLQLPVVVEGMKEVSWSELIHEAAVICLVVIVTRVIWVFPSAWLPRWLSKKIRERDPVPKWQDILVVAWCGMRGVVSLAAALALPKTFENGAEFEGRERVIFLTFAVILVTLVFQGLTLPWLIRRVKASVGHADEAMEREARVAAIDAAVHRLKQVDVEEGFDSGALVRLYEDRRKVLKDDLVGALGWSVDYQRQIETLRLRREAILAERTKLAELHESKQLSKEILHKLERELDLREALLQ